MKTALIGAGLLGAVFLVWLDLAVLTPRPIAPKSAGDQSPRDFARYHGVTSQVMKVIDGDTLDVGMPDGTAPATTVRLLGIDAPETTGDSPAMYFASEATDYARSLAAGQEVTLYLDDEAGSRGKYGRLLAYVALPDGRFLNEQLLLEGYAYADLRFRHGYYQRYGQLEAVARSLSKGIWREVSREQLPPWLQRMRPDLLSQDAHVD